MSERLSSIQNQTIDISRPPQGLIFKKKPNSYSYLLPEPGFNFSSLVDYLFCLPFFLMGVLSTIISMGLHEKFGWSMNVSGSMNAAFILGILFIIIGGFIIKISIDYAYTKHLFSYYKNEFSYATYTHGQLKEEQRYPLSQIE